MILAIETHNFHSIINVAGKMEVGDIIKGSIDLKSIKAEQSMFPKATYVGRFSNLTKATSSS